MRRKNLLRSRAAAAKQRADSMPLGPGRKAAKQAEQKRIHTRLFELHDAGLEPGPEDPPEVHEEWELLSPYLGVATGSATAEFIAAGRADEIPDYGRPDPQGG